MKSPIWNRLKASIAFTLIELLTVISIIAILMGILFPAISSVRESARKVSAKNDELNIVNAVKAYYTEYGKYPINSGSGASPTAGTYLSGTTTYSYVDYDDGTLGTNNSNDKLIDVLRNNVNSVANGTIVSSLNPRQIVFLDAPSVKNLSQPTSGVIPTSGTGKIGVYYDAWGSPYRIRIDASYANSVPNPYSDTLPPGGTVLTTGVISWAFGKNGKLGGGSPAAGSFTTESGSNGYYYATPNNNSTPTSGDVISWQ